jgi:hypothetical protein
MSIPKLMIGVFCVALSAGGGSWSWGQATDDNPVPNPTLASLAGATVASPLSLDEKSKDLEPEKGAGCCSPRCTSDCCNLCPSVYGSVEALFLKRDNQSFDQPAVITGGWPNAYDTVLSTGDLDFDWEPGLRAVAGIRLNECTGWGLEGSYFGLFNADAASLAVATDVGAPLTLPGGLGPALNAFQAADQIQLDYGSELHSADLSLVRCRDGAAGCRSVEWMAGFRYLDLSETFGITGRSDINGLPVSGVYNVRTDNNLYGAQLGARLRRCRGRLSGEVTGKAGIYYNDASQDQFILDFGDIEPRRDGRASGDHTAFLGEVNLSAIYQLTGVWGLRVGYNLIWIEGVALAPDQLDFSAATDVTQLSSNGGLFLHGVNVGLEARW